MISIRFEERQQIGLQYALETLHGCSPFGQEKIRRLRYYTPAERAELETELYNVQQAADHADQLKGVYDKICILLCQMKDIRNSIRRCRDGEVPDHVELFEIKGLSAAAGKPAAPVCADERGRALAGALLPQSQAGFGHPGPGQHPVPWLLHSRQHDRKAPPGPPDQEGAGGEAP